MWVNYCLTRLAKYVSPVQTIIIVVYLYFVSYLLLVICDINYLFILSIGALLMGLCCNTLFAYL